MSFEAVKTAACDFGARIVMKAKDKSYIAFGVAGVGLITYGTYKFVKTAPKAKDILEEHNKKLAQVAESLELAKDHKVVYTNKDAVKDKALIYAQTGFAFAKEFCPSMVMYGLGLYSICYSHRILTRRNAALAASYAALKKSYDDYREQVAAKYGADYDMKTANHIGSETIQTIDENGEVKEHKAKNVILDRNGLSPYTILIDEHTSTEYTPNGLTNMSQAEAVRTYWQERYEFRKFVDFPEVLKNLGAWDRLPDEQKAQFIGKGWVWNPEDESTHYIKFNYYDCYCNKYPEIGSDEPIKMSEPALLLEANVQGDVAAMFRDVYSRKKVCARRRAAKQQIREEATN